MAEATPEFTTSTTSTTSTAPAHSNTPTHGERAADLIFDTQADPTRDGLWIYPACYDDFHLARRRAHSLSEGFGLRFSVDLFGANGASGEVTPSVAVSEPGYYAFTTADPRPKVIYLPVRPFTMPAERIQAIQPIEPIEEERGR